MIRVKHQLQPKSFLAGIVVISIVVGIITIINASQFTPSGDFRNNLWAPAHLITQGQNPYQFKPDIKGNFLNGVETGWLVPVWFPMGIAVFFPLGLLPQAQASNLWLIGNVIALIAVIWLSTGMKRPFPVRFMLTLLAVFSFPAVLLHFYLGQFTILSMFMFLLAIFYADNTLPIKTATFSLIGLTKPQLAILVMPGLIITIFRNRGIKAVLEFSFLLSAIGLLMLSILFLADDQWYVNFIEAQRANPSWQQPSLFYILKSELEMFGVAIWAIVATFLFCLNLWLWIKLSPDRAVFWSLGLTPLITPYVWPWDFTFLIPLVVQSVFQRGWIHRWTTVGFFLTWILFLQHEKNLGDPVYWWIPWLIVGSLTTGHIMEAVKTVKHQANISKVTTTNKN